MFIHGRFLLFVIFGGLVAFGFRCQAAAPANDTFASRLVLTGNSVTSTGTNVNATVEPGEPNHALNGGYASVWWTWTAPAGGSVTIDTHGSNYDTVLAAYTGSSVSTLTEVASNDDDPVAADLTSIISFNVISGTVLQIAVDGSGGATGNILLHLSFSAAPANDTFAGATSINGLNAAVTGTNANCSKEPGEPATIGEFKDPGGKSVWWTWTAPATLPVRISTAGSSFDTLLGVYTGTSLGALTLVADDDDADGLVTSRVNFMATAGTKYVILVDGSTADANGTVNTLPAQSGNIALSVKLDATFDIFAQRVALPPNFTLTNSNVGFTKEVGEPNHAGNQGGASAWFKYTPVRSGNVEITTVGSSFDTLLAVYTGTAVGALTPVASNDNAVAGVTYSKVAFPAIAGTEYEIALDGQFGAGAVATGNFKILLTDVEASVVATTPNAQEATVPGPGAFTITLSAPRVVDTIINYTVTGTAASNTRYTSIGSKATIKAGQTSVVIMVTPKNDAIKQPTQTVILTLGTGSGYVVGATNAATVNILDDDCQVAVVNSPLAAVATLGAPFTYTITGTTTPTAFDATPLPAGLKVDKLKGIISGIPTAIGTTAVTMSASSCTFKAPGTAVLMLFVSEPPQILSPALAAPNPVPVGQETVLSLVVQGDPGDVLSYVWDYGDGTTGAGNPSAHTYAAPGNFVATVTVSNDKGLSSKSSVTVLAASPFVITSKSQLKVSFTRSSSDTLTLLTTTSLKTQFYNVSINGKLIGPPDTIKTSRQGVTTLTFRHGSLATALALDPTKVTATSPGGSYPIRILLSKGSDAFFATWMPAYKPQGNKATHTGGTFK